MKSFKRKDKSLQDPPKLFFQLLTGCPSGPCLSISPFKEKGSPTDSAVALDFISFPEYFRQTETGLMIYNPSLPKEQNK